MRSGSVSVGIFECSNTVPTVMDTYICYISKAVAGAMHCVNKIYINWICH